MSVRLLLGLFIASLAVASGQQDALVTVPINKDGERYALLDFYQTDQEYVIKTARQFCADHGFGDSDLRMIVEHTLAQMTKLSTAAPQPEAAQPDPGRAVPQQPPAAAHHEVRTTALPLPKEAEQLLVLMRTHQMTAATVMKSLAVLMEQGHTV